MTATHARPGLAGRLAGLFRRRQPDLYPTRTADYGAGYDYPDWDDEQADDRHPEPHPPWVTAPQPAFQPPRPAPSAGPGTLDALYAAADLRDQDAQLAGGHDLTVIDDPVARTRPYAPEVEFEPVSYPPLSFTADFRDLPVFKQAARKCGLAPAGLVRAAGVMLP